MNLLEKLNEIIKSANESIKRFQEKMLLKKLDKDIKKDEVFDNRFKLGITELL